MPSILRGTMPLCSLVALAVGAAEAHAQAPLPHDSLRQLVERDDARVGAIVRQLPDSARATFTHLFRLAATASADARGSHLATAHRLALAYADAWADSFYVRQVSRFEAWSPRQRLTKAAADSLRIAGNAALGTSGAASALRDWRESYRLAHSIGDSAGQGSALGNIAVAWYRDGTLDSAEHYLRRSRAIAERIGDTRTRLNAIGTLASVAKDRRDFARARMLYSNALALRPRIGDDRGSAADENNLGLVAEALGDTAGARRYYEAALDRNRRSGRASVASDNMVNLANLATLRGDYATAGALYRDALAIRRAASERAREAPVLHNLGLLELRRGDHVAARDALARAVDIYDATGPADEAITARADLAQAQGAMGDLQSALTTLRRAEAAAARDSLPDLQASLALARADLAVEFNALTEAERDFTAAAERFGALGDSVSQADARQGLGLLLLRRDDPAGATKAFDLALETRLRASRDVRAIAQTRLLLGFALVQSGDTSSGRRQLRLAQVALHGIGDDVGEATALGALADLAWRSGDRRSAERAYERALARLGARPAPNVSMELHLGHARAVADRGDLAAAAAELRGTVDATDRVAGSIRLSERRAAYRADKWIAYERLALIERQRGHETAAFEISERLRGQEMLELLAEGRVAVTPRTDTALVAREQDLRHRIATLERTLEEQTGRDHVRGLGFRADAPGASRAALDAAQREYAAVSSRLREAVPEYARLVQPITVDASVVSARLQPDEALIEYLVTDSTTLAFVARRSGLTSVDLGVGRQTLASAIDFARETIGGHTRSSSTDVWSAPLERLHRLLIEPVERSGALRGARTLLIAPHAELHYLPFAALIDRNTTRRFLIERYDIAYVPSAALWLRLADRRSAARSRGVLAFAPRPDALPASRDEVRAIQSVYGSSATVLSAAAATEAEFRARGGQFAIIHFATYGVLNKQNPLFSFVELAPDAHDDGHLAVHEVFGAALQAQLVVLSACQTALASGERADVPSGDDWIGLVRAFLFAGSDNVLATLWPVRDNASALVMRTFYGELKSHSPAAALALAQRRAIRDWRTSDPADWAAYALVGAAARSNR